MSSLIGSCTAMHRLSHFVAFSNQTLVVFRGVGASLLAIPPPPPPRSIGAVRLCGPLLSICCLVSFTVCFLTETFPPPSPAPSSLTVSPQLQTTFVFQTSNLSFGFSSWSFRIKSMWLGFPSCLSVMGLQEK